MEPELVHQFEEQSKKLEDIYVSVEKTRRYFFWTLVAQLAFFLVPLILLMIAIPFLLSSLGTAYSGLM